MLTPTPTPAVALIKEPNPPSDKYVPPFVKLTSPVSFPKYQGGTQVGLVAAPIGTKVKLVRITGLNVLINHDGQTISIPATSTDLLERMLGTAED